VGLQLATGYTVAYLVYTVGTLITAPASLNYGVALVGLAVILCFAAFIAVKIKKAEPAVATEIHFER
ncbi:MAG: hypothetical protein J6Q99_04860, partial [Oscillospiraceae bacterium]|nr:hypothetical protein [Oscillospiraceae bacterium]